MSKIISLLKAVMSSGMRIFTYGSRGDGSRHFLPLFLASLVFFSLFLSTSYMTNQLKENGTENIVLALFIFATAILTLMEGIYKSGSLLFNCHDDDMLLAMPIKKSTITFVRFFKFYVFELIYNSLFLGPAILAYAFNVEINASFILTSVIMLFLSPIIPMAISCILGVVITSLSARFKRASAIQVVFTLIILTLALVAVFLLNGDDNQVVSTVESIGGKAMQWYYPAAVYANLATKFDFGQLLLFIAINAIVTVALVAVISKLYYQITNKIKTIKHRSGRIESLKLTRRSQTRAMVMKEFTKYFNTPVLVSNTSMGLIIFLIGVVAVCIKFDDLAATIANLGLPFTVSDVYSYAPSIAFALIAFTSLLTFISTTMISLEGKAFNLLKSMPISGRRVIFAKVLASILLTIPATALGTIVLAIRFHFSIIDFLLLLVAVVVLPLVTESIGILIDLKYTRFEAENDAEIVKQSPGIMASSFLGLFMVIATLPLAFVLAIFCGQTAGLIIINGVFIVISLFLIMAIASRGEEKYTKLSA